MKKLAVFVLAMACFLSLTGCKAQQAKDQPEQAKDQPEYFVEEDGEQYLLLPISGTKVLIYDGHKQYIEKIDMDLLKTAEETLSAQIPQDESEPFFYLQMEEGDMYLCVETIVYIDPPETVTMEDGTVISSGCGIDHEHIFYSERISK